MKISDEWKGGVNILKNKMNLLISETLTFNDHIRMALIEENYFDKDLISPPEITWKWYLYNPDTVICVRDVDTGIIVGHLSLIPISNELFDLIMSGSYVDTHIPIEHIRQFNNQGKYKMYLCAVAVAPEYKNTLTLRMLIKAYIEKFVYLSNQGIIISDIIADAITGDGNKFCSKVLGMNLITNSEHDSQVYWAGETVLQEKLKQFMKKTKKI